jgi:hypothetical protein
MDRPPFNTVLSAAVASAAAFFVITRSGIAGTLAGAAVASLVYTGASHGLRHALERLVGGVRRRFLPAAKAPVDEAPTAISAEGDGGAAAGTLLLSSPVHHRPARRVTATWGPVVLAAAALLTSVYSMTSGTPIERIVVRERIVERPVVTERVVVRTQVVSGPPSAPVHGTQEAPATPTTTTTVVATGPVVTTPTAATTTTSTAPPTPATTSTVPPVPTTAPTVPAP